MTTHFDISSRVSNAVFDVLGIEVKGASGTSIAPVQGIPLYSHFYATGLIQNQDRWLNLSAIKYDFIVRSIYWGNLNRDNNTENLLIEIWSEGRTQKTGSIEIPAPQLDEGYGLVSTPAIIRNNAEIKLRPQFDMDIISFNVQPCVVMDDVNVG